MKVRHAIRLAEQPTGVDDQRRRHGHWAGLRDHIPNLRVDEQS